MDSDIKMTLGANIKKFREEREMLQKVLAYKVGISDRTLSLIEKGKQNNPGIQTVRKIAEILDVSIDELFSGIAEKTDRLAMIKYNRLSDLNKITVMDYMEFLSKRS